MAETHATTESNNIITIDDYFRKIKELVKPLEADVVAHVVGILVDELENKIEGSSNKSRVLLDAITSTKQRLEKLVHNSSSKEEEEVVAAPDGVNATGNTVVAAEDIGKENDNKVASTDLAADPLRISSSSSCDNNNNNKFLHTAETAAAAVKDDEVPNISDDDHEDKFGIILVDEYDTFFGTLRRESGYLELIYKLSVVPPKRRVRSGMEAYRYCALRGRRHDELISKTAEVANKLYINPATGQVNVSGGLILGGTRIGFKLLRYLDIDPRVVAKIVYKVDVSCGGEEGLNEVIDRWCLEHRFSRGEERRQS